MSTELVLAYDHPEEIRELFNEYTEMLVREDPHNAAFLELQHYDDELNHLEKKYGLPDGRLYLAFVDGTAAGTVGLRKLDENCGELKRLYVKPEFRCRRLGKQLTERIILDAKSIGYTELRLDTLPFLKRAIHMYQELGFVPIERYNDSPMDISIYLSLDLKQRR